MKKKIMNREGFTLIELLAVIVILAILMTLAVTSMQRYINNAKKDTYITTAQQFLQYARLGVVNGDYTSPAYGECTAIHTSKIETTTGDETTSSFGKKFKDANSYVLVYNSSETGSDTLTYYMTMSDEQNNGFIITEESKLSTSNRDIINVRGANNFSGVVLPAQDGTVNLSDSKTCTLTHIDN